MAEIIQGPFHHRKELEPLSERDQELVELWTKEIPEDENILQKNYRVNRLKEFDDLVTELVNMDYPNIKK